MQTLGILGGTFNPPHQAHFLAAVETLEKLQLSELLLVPAFIAPHKEGGEILPFELRLRMLERLAETVPGLKASDLESKRSGPSYTVDLLAECKRIFSNKELFFIMGTGDFLMLPHWKDGLSLGNYAHLVIMSRYGQWRKEIKDFLIGPGFDMKANPLEEDVWILPNGHKIILCQVTRTDVSATLIRESWRSGRSIGPYVSEATLKILAENRKIVEKHWGYRAADKGIF